MTHLGYGERLKSLKQQVIKTAQGCVNSVSSMIIKMMLAPKGPWERGSAVEPWTDLA